MSLAVRLLHVAWMSVALGIAVELLLVIIAAAYGAATEVRPILADAAQKVSWSVLVCTGIALGTAAARSVRTAAMGLLGLLSAPLAFAAAKATHKALAQGLSFDDTSGASPLVIAIIKGIEFACLGLAVGWLSTKAWAGLRTHLLVGLATGIVFGGTVLGYTYATAATPAVPVQFIITATNELIYPTGCALILFAAGALGARVSGKD